MTTPREPVAPADERAASVSSRNLGGLTACACRVRDLLRRRPLILLVLFGGGFWFLFPGLRRETITLRFSRPPACPAMVRASIMQEDALLRRIELPLSKTGLAEHPMELVRGTYDVHTSLICTYPPAAVEGPRAPRTLVVDRAGAVTLPLEARCPCAAREP